MQVHAGFIDLAAILLKLIMMIYYHTMRVETSLAVLVSPDKPSILAAIDPFRIWFWILISLGLGLTRQLSVRMAIIASALLCLGAMGLRAAWMFSLSSLTS